MSDMTDSLTFAEAGAIEWSHAREVCADDTHRVTTSTMTWPETRAQRKPVTATMFALYTLLVLLMMAVAAVGIGQQPAPGATATLGTPAAHNNAAATSLQLYLQRVRAQTMASTAAPGALWSEEGRFTRLNADVRASRPHDLISVVVQESLAASTDGTVKNSRASNASSQVSSLLGALHAGNALQNLVNQNSAAGLNAQGVSATNSSLSTTFGGQVVDVLPNGMLVIEAARQVEFTQQTQTILLRGLVRPEDISQQNEIRSTAIASLELEVKGHGIINDYTHRANPFVRLIQKLLIF